MSFFDMMRAAVGIPVFLAGFGLFLCQNAAQPDIVAVGFAIMLMGGGIALVPDRDSRNG